MDLVVQSPDPLIGTTIDGRYQVLNLLGRGGMGVVFRVEHVLLKKEMALKILLRDMGASDDIVQRFRREAEAVARLQHQNIIAVTDFGRLEDGRMYLVMELLEGPSLAKAMEQGALPLERAVHIQRQILRALDHAHGLGIVHRDLKPDNIILVEREGMPDTVKLLDFGIAKLTREPAEGTGGIVTVEGAIFGTPEYMAPEQAVGDAVDHRADLYAAGVILYEMLAGRRPFVSQSRLEIISMHVTQDAMPLADSAPHVPPHISLAVSSAMVKRRDERVSTAQQFMDALDGPGVVPSPFSGARAIVPSLHEMPVVPEARISAFGRLERALASRGVPRPRIAAAGAILGAVLIVIGLLGLVRRAPTVPATGTPGTSPSVLTSMLTPGPDLSKAEKSLRTGRSCKERKVAAQLLIDSHDKQWLPALIAAKDRKGGFLNLDHVNGCMTRDLDAAIKKLDGK